MSQRDLTFLQRRLVDRYHAQGMSYPEVAAFAVAVRGRTSFDQNTFAQRHRLEPGVVEAAESGQLPFERLPHPYQNHMNPH